MNKVVATLLGMIFLFGGIMASRAGAQEIDPFYLRRLESGERAFLVGNYETAVEELKIVLFGLMGEEQLKAKAYVYLGMSYYYLNHRDRAETCLKDAKNILGMEGLRALVTDESVWFYLNKLLMDFKLVESGAVQLQKRIIRSDPKIIARDLERQIKSNPREISLYYDLYKHHMGNSETSEARKTLENLIKKNPNEAKGYYLLGRIQYQQRDLKEAEKNLGKVFELQEKVPVEEFVILEAKIYQILTFLLRGDKNRTYRMFALWSERLSEDKIRYLDLEEMDKGIFRGIVGSEEARAEIERLRSQDVGDTGGNLPVENIVPLDQVDTPPILKERINPKYPSSAIERGIEGKVIVNALISESGDVEDVVVVQGLAGGFNEATMRAVRQWKYEPAVKDGQKVKVWKPITITFKTR
jgi:TonB family protein